MYAVVLGFHDIRDGEAGEAEVTDESLAGVTNVELKSSHYSQYQKRRCAPTGEKAYYRVRALGGAIRAKKLAVLGEDIVRCRKPP